MYLRRSFTAVINVLMITSGVNFDSVLTDYKSPVSTSVLINSANTPLVRNTESGNINGNASILEFAAHKLEISQCRLPLFNELTASPLFSVVSLQPLLSSIALSLICKRTFVLDDFLS